MADMREKKAVKAERKGRNKRKRQDRRHRLMTGGIGSGPDPCGLGTSKRVCYWISNPQREGSWKKVVFRGPVAFKMKDHKRLFKSIGI